MFSVCCFTKRRPQNYTFFISHNDITLSRRFKFFVAYLEQASKSRIRIQTVANWSHTADDKWHIFFNFEGKKSVWACDVFRLSIFIHWMMDGLGSPKCATFCGILNEATAEGGESQVRIQDLCKGGPAEILPTSRSRVAAAAKIWASKWGVRGGPGPLGPPLDPHLKVQQTVTSCSLALSSYLTACNDVTSYLDSRRTLTNWKQNCPYIISA